MQHVEELGRLPGERAKPQTNDKQSVFSARQDRSRQSLRSFIQLAAFCRYIRMSVQAPQPPPATRNLHEAGQ